MKKLNKTKYAVLGLLTIEPLTGYDISKIIENKLSHFWAESNGQIYPTLNTLVKEKMINLLSNNSTSKKITKKYEITPKGFLELQKWLSDEKDEKITYRNESLLKLFFGKNNSKELCINRLKEKKQQFLEKLLAINSIYEELKKEASSPHFPYWEIIIKNGIYSLKADLKWCSEAIKKLQSIK